ncbi:hypothetical protein ACNKHK_24670 [Shigella flexneri]
MHYAEQPSPDRISRRFIIGETFLNGEPSCRCRRQYLLWSGISSKTASCGCRTQGATVFGYQVMDPERFGVVEFDEECAQSHWKRNRKNRSLTGR